MNQNEREQLYNEAIKKWGKDFQIQMCIEEMAELIVQLAKYKRTINGSNFSAICDEVADVEIMLEQLHEIFKDNSSFERIIKNRKEQKLQRLKEYLRR